MKKYFVAMLLSAALVFGGCASMGGNAPSSAEDYFNRYQHIIRLAVNVGVVNLLDANPTYADRLMNLATIIDSALADVSQFDNFEVVEKLIMERINWSAYQPTERLLAEALMTTIRIELTNVLKADCKPAAENEPVIRDLCFEGLPETPEKVKFYVDVISGWIQEGVGLWRSSNSNRDVLPLLPPVK